MFARIGRDSANFGSRILKRITPKYHQTPLGSYPFPPESEMLWKNRRTAYGGYFQHSISPFQLKFLYPLFHQGQARIWAKLSQTFWWIIWPTAMTYVGVKGMYKVNDMYIRRNNFY